MDEHPTDALKGVAYGLMLSIILWITILFVVGSQI
jgi:hypothetical protein